MKPTRPVVKSLKIMIKKVQSADNFYPNKVVDTTVIPIGSTDSFIELPRLRDTYTYNLINTAEMTGAITLKTSRGASLKGLILNNVGGTLNIEPIPQGTTSFEMGSDVKDGCFVETLSNGNNWFIWSVATHGTLGIGQVGNNNASPPTSTTTQVPAPVTLNPIQSNTTFPPSANFEARHSIIISGDAEPGATIVISEESGLIGDITVTVEDDGSWSTNEITDLENEDYNFVFTPSVGEAATDQEFASNDGVLSFATPQSFTIERGEAYDFTVGASAVDTNNVLITPFNVDDSQYNTSLVHGATFDIVYSFNYLGTPYTRTVSGVVEDTIAPAKPTIASATFDSVNINDFTATGAAEDGSTVEIFFDGVSQGTVTSVGGTWSYTSTFVFNQTFEITVQATDSASNISEESDATSVVYSPPTLTRPTLTIVNAPINTWTNQANTIELSGTTDAGSTIVIKDGNVVVTPVSGPNYSGNNWDATINVADESNSSITIEASKANFNSPSPSIAKTLLIDRVPPAISGTPLGDLTVYLGNIGDNNDNIPTATDFSSATVASDWSTQVDAAEGAKTVTYTATDAAGNTTTETRTVNVLTEVIVPVVTAVTDLGNGTGTVEGTVTGTYADNLTVQVLVDELDDGSPVEVLNSSFSYTTTNLGNGTFAINAITINSVGEESGLSNEETLLITAPIAQFLEESTAATRNLTHETRVEITDGVFSRTVAQDAATYVNLSDEGVLSYGSNGERVHTAMTLSFWLKPDEDFQSGTKILGFLSAVNDNYDGFGIRMGKRNGGTNIELAPYIAQLGNTFRTDVNLSPTFYVGQWYHGAIVVTEFDASGTSDVKLFINGVLGATRQIEHTLLQYQNRSNFGIGTYMVGANGASFQTSSNRLSLDSIQIADNVALLDSQVAAIYNQSDRQMTIAEVPEDTTIPVITLTGNASVSFTVGGTYTDAGATATDDVDGDITSDIVTTIVDASDVAATLDSNTAAGTYTVRYDVSDAAGNDAVRVVRVVEVLADISFLEDLDSISTHGNASIVNGIFSRNSSGTSGTHGATFNLVDEGIVTFNSDGTRVDEELTVSFWFRPDEAWGSNWFYVGGHERGAGTQFKLAVMNNGGDLEFRAILFGGIQYKNSPSSSALNIGDWYHLAMTYSQNASNPSNHDLKMFVNGEKVIESLNLSGNLMKMTNTVKDFGIGGYAQGTSLGGNSLNHSSNSWQIASGIALTEGQVAAIANQSDQEMTIAEAAANEFGIASVIDDVYNDPTSTIVGSPTLTNSILEITGDDYIINGDIAEYMYQDYLSISFWIKSTEETQAAVNKFVSLGWSHAGNNKFGHVIGTQTTSPYNGFRVITPSGGALDETVPTGDWFDEQWHMLTLTWDNINGEKKFYYDGQQLGTTTTFSSKSDPFRDGDDLYGLIIGTGTGAAGGIRSGEAFRGKMTNMVINNFIWTDQQVSDLYDVNFNGNLHFSANIEEVGTLSGNASLVNGVLVSSALGDYTSMPMTSAFKSNSFQTISFWFKTTYTPTNGTWMRFIHSQVNGQGSNGFFIEMRSSTKIYFKGASQALVADNNPAAEAPSALNDGAWHQIIVSWEDLGVEKLRIWVDGAPMTVLDETLVGSGNDNKNTLFIGAKQFDSPMEMDKVAITEEFIDDAEALARYNYEAP